MLSVPGTGLLVTAGVLGVTHGLEPDHVAGITTLTRKADDPRRSAFVGGLFAAGHVGLVVVWVAIATVSLGGTSVPAAFSAIGQLVVGVLLGVLGISLGLAGVSTLLHRHEHRHGGRVHAHWHLHLPPVGRRGATGHVHEHGPLRHLRVGAVGALFTLSPPLSMLAFVTVALGSHGSGLVVGLVAAYALAIVLTMTVVGGGVGAVFGLAQSGGNRVRGILQVVAAVGVVVVAALVLGPVLL